MKAFTEKLIKAQYYRYRIDHNYKHEGALNMAIKQVSNYYLISILLLGLNLMFSTLFFASVSKNLIYGLSGLAIASLMFFAIFFLAVFSHDRSELDEEFEEDDHSHREFWMDVYRECKMVVFSVFLIGCIGIFLQLIIKMP